MKKASIWFVVALFGMVGCGSETESTSEAAMDKSAAQDDHVWRQTTNTMDRAREAGQSLEINVNQKQQKIEESTR